MVRELDELTDFEEFRREILPALRKDLQKGMSAADIYKKYQSHAAARSVTIAMAEVDSSKANAAIRDILDRTQGKATERKEVTHKLENAKDEEIDAFLLSKLKALDEIKDSKKH